MGVFGCSSIVGSATPTAAAALRRNSVVTRRTLAWASVRECPPRDERAAAPTASSGLLRFALIGRPVVVSKLVQTLAGVAALARQPYVLLRERTQQGDEHAESGEDVDDREGPRGLWPPYRGRSQIEK
jgi:hypothetical protein